MLIDIHSHQVTSDANIKKLFNLDIKDTDLNVDFETFFGNQISVSVGIHPWSVSELEVNNQLEFLEIIANDQRVNAIGEIGLDKLRGPNLKIQEYAFLKQIRIAEKVKKPILIHCVRCFNELIAIKKVIRPKVSLIIHGFNKKADLAKDLTQKGFFLSFGKGILESELIQDALLISPTNQIFFETDNSKEIEIEEIYNKAAEILKVDMRVLINQVYKNYLELYI